MQQIIETPRLLLRPFADSDAAQNAKKINDYDIAKNLARVPYPYHLEDSIEFLAWLKTVDARSCFRVITLKSEPQNLLGAISVEWSEDKQNADLGYWLVKEHWGKGLMSEAAIAMVAESFQNGGIEKIISCFFKENPASGKVLARAGFEVTGSCSVFSKAQGAEIPATTVALTRARWLETHI
jgi:RimJ/RimL family protein N-acetyltransferase